MVFRCQLFQNLMILLNLWSSLVNITSSTVDDKVMEKIQLQHRFYPIQSRFHHLNLTILKGM